MKKNKALTLLELVIAVSIFTVIIVTIYSAFQSGIFGYRNIEDSVEIYQTARIVLERINLDLRNSFAYMDKDKNTKFLGTDKEINFLSLTDTYRNGKIIPEFSFVSYKLGGDKLMRLCRKNSEALKEDSEIHPEELAYNVADIKFAYSYLDADGKILEKNSWSDEDDQKKMPIAVKVNLNLKGKIEQAFERTIWLPCAVQ